MSIHPIIRISLLMARLVEDILAECDGTVTGSGIRVGTVGVTIDYNYLQYRTPAGVYRGYLELTKDGIPVDQADINKIELKDSNGDPVILDPVNPVGNYIPSTYFRGRWNPATASVDFSGTSINSRLLDIISCGI